MISQETVINFFKDLKEANDFNSNEKLLWGYFFLDSNKKKLEDFSLKLEQLGYRFKNIFEAEKINEGDKAEYYLHVEKIEHHTVDSLYALNNIFYDLVTENNIDFYDGFDVGSIISSENIR
ncbi:ribonuclease E inhibitor RraB [Flavobacterium aestivum]|uniref:ribonuclease E inhibitor RraB n=1 Tax=Flavobacterium aestivum TaxID=3003257 RepID=UPI002482410E|nr:ribonuclease E inhibitor RraB [Flavobacterium aestivum]